MERLMWFAIEVIAFSGALVLILFVIYFAIYSKSSTERLAR